MSEAAAQRGASGAGGAAAQRRASGAGGAAAQRGASGAGGAAAQRRASGDAEGAPTGGDRLAALGEALDAVGDRWTLLLVAALLEGPRRFGDLQRELPGIAPNVLTQRLRSLEGRRLVVAQPYSERPPRFVYELTAPGRELAGALRQLADWGARHHDEAEAPRHAVCGTPLEARWYCPTCELPVDDEDADRLHFA